MATRKILIYGNPLLRKCTKTIKKNTPEIKALIDDMVETMQAAKGIGLAATQVGALDSIVVTDVGDGLITLINPKIVNREGKQYGLEGCLSFPGLYGDVERAAQVLVKGRNKAGRNIQINAEGLLARVLQHEIDHLNGRLFVDLVDRNTLHFIEASDGNLRAIQEHVREQLAKSLGVEIPFKESEKVEKEEEEG